MCRTAPAMTADMLCAGTKVKKISAGNRGYGWKTDYGKPSTGTKIMRNGSAKFVAANTSLTTSDTMGIVIPLCWKLHDRNPSHLDRVAADLEPRVVRRGVLRRYFLGVAGVG